MTKTIRPEVIAAAISAIGAFHALLSAPAETVTIEHVEKDLVQTVFTVFDDLKDINNDENEFIKLVVDITAELSVVAFTNVDKVDEFKEHARKQTEEYLLDGLLSSLGFSGDELTKAKNEILGHDDNTNEENNSNTGAPVTA